MNNEETLAGDSRKPTQKNYYIDGITASVAKRIAKYTFNSRLIQFQKDTKERIYVVYVKDDTDDGVIQYLKDNFSCFKVIKVTTEEA